MATVIERSEKLKASIEAQAKKLAQLKLQKAKLDHQDKGARKKADTRKKILVGSYMMAQMESKEDTKNRMLSGLEKYLTRPDERALFGFAPLPVVVLAVTS